MSEKFSDPLLEIESMKLIANALNGLDADATSRVLRWAADRYSVVIVDSTSPSPVEGFQSAAPSDHRSDVISQTYETVADLYTALTPRFDPDKAMAVAYWFQIIQGNPDFDSQSLNKELKHLGFGVSNITTALSSLIKRKPQLVIQTRKSGTSQQARKRYKLTTEGRRVIEDKLSLVP